MEIKVGKECLVVTTGNEARYGTKIYKATITKVGRKWFQVETPESYYIGRDERFSLEASHNDKNVYMCDGKNYISNYYVIESEEVYNRMTETPKLLKELTASISSLEYEDLITVQKFIHHLKEKDNGN